MTDNEQLTITKYDLYYESRMTKMETIAESLKNSMEEIRGDMREIRSDIRWMLGIMLGFAGIMLSLMAKGFHWIGA